LEEGMEMDNDVQEQKEEFDEEFDDYKEDEFADYEDRDLDIDSYLHDDYSGYKMQGDGNGGEEEEKEMPIMMVESLTDHLNTQLGFFD
jgi:RNA polymerase sigma-54 factor